MEGKTFERELPRGYKIATVMDASKGRFAVVFTLISFLFLIVAVAAMALPFVFEPEDIDDLPYLSVSFTHCPHHRTAGNFSVFVKLHLHLCNIAIFFISPGCFLAVILFVNFRE